MISFRACYGFIRVTVERQRWERHATDAHCRCYGNVAFLSQNYTSLKIHVTVHAEKGVMCNCGSQRSCKHTSQISSKQRKIEERIWKLVLLFRTFNTKPKFASPMTDCSDLFTVTLFSVSMIYPTSSVNTVTSRHVHTRMIKKKKNTCRLVQKSLKHSLEDGTYFLQRTACELLYGCVHNFHINHTCMSPTLIFVTVWTSLQQNTAGLL